MHDLSRAHAVESIKSSPGDSNVQLARVPLLQVILLSAFPGGLPPVGGRAFLSGETAPGKRNPHTEGTLWAAGICEPDAGRRPGVHLVLRLSPIPLCKAAPGPSATRGVCVSRANRLQDAGSRFGARIGRGGDTGV